MCISGPANRPGKIMVKRRGSNRLSYIAEPAPTDPQQWTGLSRLPQMCKKIVRLSYYRAGTLFTINRKMPTAGFEPKTHISQPAA